VAYLQAIGSRRAPDRCATAKLILGFALLFRLTFLAPPRPDDDIYRYSGMAASPVGRQPYLKRPPQPAPLAGDPLYARLAHKEVGTIYPPAAQLLFAAEPRCAGPGRIKIIFVLCDLAATGLLLSCSVVSSCPPPGPDLCLESSDRDRSAWSGHLEPPVCSDPAREPGDYTRWKGARRSR